MKKKYGAKQIEENELEPIPFRYKEPKTLISFTCPEGTSVCPRSGFPDFWTAHIWLVPKNSIVELKSLKLYVNSYRDRAVYHEELPHLILQDLQKALKPSYLKIVMDYTRRGNIQTDVILEYKEPAYKGPEAPVWEVRRNFR
ncbi:MAG: preQ(1) synthase [Deltaproteobacteria bacterium]|nr:preQ(1) synthase [Deltaproteobacteria bacterium]